jgi:hypothetical protein
VTSAINEALQLFNAIIVNDPAKGRMESIYFVAYVNPEDNTSITITMANGATYSVNIQEMLPSKVTERTTE